MAERLVGVATTKEGREKLFLLPWWPFLGYIYYREGRVCPDDSDASLHDLGLPRFGTIRCWQEPATRGNIREIHLSTMYSLGMECKKRAHRAC